MGIIRFSIALLCLQLMICVFMSWYMWRDGNDMDNQISNGSWKYTINGESFMDIPTKDVPWDSMNTIIFTSGMTIYCDTGK